VPSLVRRAANGLLSTSAEKLAGAIGPVIREGAMSDVAACSSGMSKPWVHEA
jgi:hypothetical protein